MRHVNMVVLVGNVGADPELRETKGRGIPVSNFSIATNESFKNANGGTTELVTWHHLVAWRNQALYAAKAIHKGDLVYAQGCLRDKPWVDKNGVQHSKKEVHLVRVSVLSAKQQRELELNEEELSDEEMEEASTF